MIKDIFRSFKNCTEYCTVDGQTSQMRWMRISWLILFLILWLFQALIFTVYMPDMLANTPHVLALPPLLCNKTTAFPGPSFPQNFVLGTFFSIIHFGNFPLFYLYFSIYNNIFWFQNLPNSATPHILLESFSAITLKVNKSHHKTLYTQTSHYCEHCDQQKITIAALLSG